MDILLFLLFNENNTMRVTGSYSIGFFGGKTNINGEI